jgi:hypothetical protein
MSDGETFKREDAVSMLTALSSQSHDLTPFRGTYIQDPVRFSALWFQVGTPLITFQLRTG